MKWHMSLGEVDMSGRGRGISGADQYLLTRKIRHDKIIPRCASSLDRIATGHIFDVTMRNCVPLCCYGVIGWRTVGQYESNDFTSAKNQVDHFVFDIPVNTQMHRLYLICSFELITSVTSSDIYQRRYNITTNIGRRSDSSRRDAIWSAEFHQDIWSPYATGLQNICRFSEQC